MLEFVSNRLRGLVALLNANVGGSYRCSFGVGNDATLLGLIGGDAGFPLVYLYDNPRIDGCSESGVYRFRFYCMVLDVPNLSVGVGVGSQALLDGDVFRIVRSRDLCLSIWESLRALDSAVVAYHGVVGVLSGEIGLLGYSQDEVGVSGAYGWLFEWSVSLPVTRVCALDVQDFNQC